MKILIISHNPMCANDNMGKTLSNLFNNFSRNDLCQLYFRDQKCDFSVCSSFYLISEKHLFNHLFKFWQPSGIEIKECYTVKKTKTEEEIYKIGRNSKTYVYFLRNFLWLIAKPFDGCLKKWIIKERPTAIFFAAGDYSFAYDFVYKIGKKFDIPIYIYFTDEYYFISKKSSLMNNLQKLQFQNAFNKLMKNSKKYYCISESMLKLYKNNFNIPGEILMNSINVENIEKQARNILKREKMIISYIGNISFGRWKSLIDISQVINKLNIECKEEKYEFNVFSGESSEDLIKKIQNVEGLHFCGSIGEKKIKEVMFDSDILVHTESFEKENIESVKHSVSTKIPDYLASGCLILAYGPDEVESINYLRRNSAALICNSIEELYNSLKTIGDLNVSPILNISKDLLNKNHDCEKSYSMLLRDFTEINDGK